MNKNVLTSSLPQHNWMIRTN